MHRGCPESVSLLNIPGQPPGGQQQTRFGLAAKYQRGQPELACRCMSSAIGLQPNDNEAWIPSLLHRSYGPTGGSREHECQYAWRAPRLTCDTWALMDASVLQLACRTQTAIRAVSWHAMPHVRLNHSSNPPAYSMRIDRLGPREKRSSRLGAGGTVSTTRTLPSESNSWISVKPSSGSASEVPS